MKASRTVVSFLLFVTQPLSGYLYTNTYSGTVTNFAIQNFGGKTLAAVSRTYVDTTASGTTAFDSDAPIYFTDVRNAIGPLHHFLGFCDFIVSPDYSSNFLPWKMYGDNDKRDLFDLRALDSENTVWDMIDTNYKTTTRNLAYNNANLWITSVNPGANTAVGKWGEFCVARFAVPVHTNGGYYLSLGKQIIRVGNAGSEGSYNGSVKVNVYSVNVTNVIAVKAVLENSLDGQFEDAQIVQDITSVRGRINRVVKGVPVSISARLWNPSGIPVSRYEWNLGDGTWIEGESRISTTFSTNGTYVIGVRATAGGRVVSNLGSPCDDAANFAAQVPDQSPSPLPLVLTVMAAPASNSVGLVRPSPLVIGTSGSVRLDVRMATEQNLVVSVFNLNGNLVRNLIAGQVPAGYVVAEWDGKDDFGRIAGEGIYFFHVSSPNMSEKRKFHVLRAQ